MNTELTETPSLKMALATYLLLGITDTVHHVHATLRLDQPNAMHAAVAGLILMPIATASVCLFKRKRNSVCLRIFVLIAIVAILIPGFYHGGWNHLIKVLAYLRLETANTEIQLLFPNNNPDLWFYEITGILELVFAIVCLAVILRLYRAR